MPKRYRGRLYQERSKRYHSLTGNLPGQLVDPTGKLIPFNKVLDVSANGIGLEVSKYLEVGTELMLTVDDQTFVMDVVYCVSVPKEEIYRCGIKIQTETKANLVDVFRTNGCNYLVPVDSDQYTELLFKKSG